MKYLLSVAILFFISVPPARGSESPSKEWPVFQLPLSSFDRIEKNVFQTITRTDDERGDLRFSPDGGSLMAGKKFRWDIAAGRRAENSPYPDVSHVTSDWKRLVIVGGAGEKDRLWDVDGAKEIRAFKGSEKSSRRGWGALSPDGKWFAGAEAGAKGYFGPTKRILIWDTRTGKIVKKLKRDRKRGRYPILYDLSFSPDSRLLAGSTPESINFWATGNWKKLRSIESITSFTATFSPDSRTLTGSDELWDLATGKSLFKYPRVGLSGGSAAQAFSPDGKLLALGYYRSDPIIMIVDARTGDLISKRGWGGEKAIDALAFSPDGKILAAANGNTVSLLKDRSLKDVMLAISPGHDTPPTDHLVAKARRKLERERERKLAALRKGNKALLAPKGEFETTPAYEQRLAQFKALVGGLRKEYSAKIKKSTYDIRNHVRGAWIKDMENRKSISYLVEGRVVIGAYDADRQEFQVEFMGQSFAVPVPLTKAPGIRNHSGTQYIKGKVGFLDHEKVSFTEAVLKDHRYDHDYTRQQGYGLARQTKFFAAPAAKAPPDLEIVGLSLVDDSADNVLGSGESGLVRVRIKNAGSGPAYGAVLGLVLDKKGVVAGISLQESTFFGTLGPGEEKVVEAPIAGLEGLVSGEVRIKALVREANGFDSKPMILSFNTREFKAPKLEVARVVVLGAGGGRVIEKGKETELTLTVQNSGAGPARDVWIGLKTGDSRVKIFGKTRIELGSLAPGERKKAGFSVMVTRRYKGPAELPLSFSVGEQRPAYAVDPELKLVLGREAPDIQVVRMHAKKAQGLMAAEDIDRVPVVPDARKALGKNDLAVVIGIERYHMIPHSDYSYADAKLVRSYLQALGLPKRNIKFLSDSGATRSSFTKYLERWLKNRVKKDSRVFIYYSGHGSPNPVSGEAYLMPYDGDPNYLAETAYPLKRLYKNLGMLKAKEVVVFLDSCFSGAGGRSVLAKGARPLVTTTRRLAIAPNMAVMSATQGAQISTSSEEKGHGVFTYYLLKAIKAGKGDLSEIYEYLKPLVEDEAAGLNVTQSPSLRPAPEKIKGRFILRR